MSLENPLWRAPRIHGELLKLAVCSKCRSRRNLRIRYAQGKLIY
jgi:hypothetical protein